MEANLYQEILNKLEKVKIYNNNTFFIELNSILEKKIEDIENNKPKIHFYKLPYELILIILKELDFETLNSLMLVNNYLYRIIKYYLQNVTLLLIPYNYTNLMSYIFYNGSFDIFLFNDEKEIINKVKLNHIKSIYKLKNEGRYNFSNINNFLYYCYCKSIIIYIEDNYDFSFILSIISKTLIKDKNINILLNYYNQSIIKDFYNNQNIKYIYLIKEKNHKYYEKYSKKLLLLKEDN